MEHGSESFDVLGEGLIDEALGGRPRTLTAAVERATPRFRFSRMGPRGSGKQLGEAVRRALADAMTADNRRPGRIDAGYTYLGQFLDHDLTFDKTSLMESGALSPADLEAGRSPTFDLDSLYGSGPGNPRSARFYSDGVRLKLGQASGRPRRGFDLPRGSTGRGAARRKAVIPDARNDENLAVAQLHLAFMRFHNRVVDTLPSSMSPVQRFREARRLVTLHYQWMIRTDYLPKICERSVVSDVWRNGRKAFEPGAPPTSMPTMPLEFSVAAFRLGHSMIRAEYSWNVNFPDSTLGQLFDFSATSGNLGGGVRLPSIWIADFRRLFDFGAAGRNDLVVSGRNFNKAMRIDTKLVDPLRRLRISEPQPNKNLAFRNLTRAGLVRLATGQQMATFMRRRGVGLTKLTRAQLRDGNGGADLDGLTGRQRDAVLTNTPLWFYVLREAELNGGKLDGVGARIVAETFHRAIEGSRFSIVHDTAFRPTFGPDGRTFRMVDLLLFAFEGKKNLLNPNG